MNRIIAYITVIAFFITTSAYANLQSALEQRIDEAQMIRAVNDYGFARYNPNGSKDYELTWRAINDFGGLKALENQARNHFAQHPEQLSEVARYEDMVVKTGHGHDSSSGWWWVAGIVALLAIIGAVFKKYQAPQNSYRACYENCVRYRCSDSSYQGDYGCNSQCQYECNN
jgi:hypothetical protein